ncbi:MAG: S8 family peptidase [Clostridium sp.]|nr:S8 family peptidase [Clostridium sp.]
MSENNLPIKLVLPKISDIVPNTGGGKIKFFGEVTPDLQRMVSDKFESLLSFYSDVFDENETIPAVGKITVKPEAIAKSHKPTDLCRNCPIIGSEDLDEIYIKVNRKNIQETIEMVKNPPSQKFQANMTAIVDIQPIKPEEKISSTLQDIVREDFNSIKKSIKLKIFDFNDDFDNAQILEYVTQKLKSFHFENKYEIISYGDQIKFFKVEVTSYDDIIKLASINGVKTVGFFQEYSLPRNDFSVTELQTVLDTEYRDSDITIGIIDGGISDDNPFLKPYIVAREEYVSTVYQNPKHATFIASTIQYGNILNNLSTSEAYRFKFVDIVAIPNSDKDFGPIDSITEYDLMEIIEEVMDKYSQSTKIWNLSLGIESKPCDGSMSDLGIFLDYIQDKYHVQIFVSSGNINSLPLRNWPPQKGIGEHDRLISPADSVRAITVGSVALFDSADSIVKFNEPSPFSRRGPGANYIVKPDIVDYGGNFSTSYKIDGLGVNGLDPLGRIIEGNGTSYSTPRSLQKYASIYEEMIDPDLLLAKAMLIHSARMNSRELLDEHPDNIKYYGFGIPSTNTQDILQCSQDCVTLVFKQKISQGSHLEMYDFPYPKSLIKNNKYIGEIGMTLAYLPPLDSKYGREYCRTNIDVSFGTYSYLDNGKIAYKGQVPLESKWDEKFEAARVEHGFKWSPIKSYYRKLSRGINLEDGWKLRIDLTPRDGLYVPSQEFVLIITIKDSNGNDIYSEITNGLRDKGYATNNIETKYQIRQRQ